MDATSLSNDELICQVRTWAARVARGDAQLLELIAELEAREAWAGHGITSCAKWLSWQLGWSGSTARERVRVALALRSLPLIRAALGEGRVTYSQVRAITRIATAEDEVKWLDLARYGTGEQLDKAARGVDRATAADRDPAERPIKQAVRVDWDDDGDLVLTLRLPAHEAVPVLAALEQHQTAAQVERDEKLAALMAELPEVDGVGASAEALQLELPTPRTAADDADAVDAAPDAEAAAEADAASSGAVDGSAASAEAPAIDLLTVPAAARCSPLDYYPFVEPAYPIHDDRMFAARTPAEEQALAAWRQQLEHERTIRNAWNDRREQLLIEASAHRVPIGRATLADALVRAVLRPTDCAPVTVQLLHDPLSGWARTQHDELLPPATLADVLATLPRKRTRQGSLAVATDLSGCDQGRSSRTVSPALRRLLGQLDGERCRFPGCSHTRFLHAHHVLFWRDGGQTDLANMILLCTAHHQLLHTAGYQLTLAPDRSLTVTSPDGSVLKHRPELPTASAEALPDADATTLDRDYTGDRFDLGYVVNVMLSHAA